MSVSGVTTFSPASVRVPPSPRAEESAQKNADNAAVPYVSPVLRVDVSQGEPVHAFRDRDTGEVTEQRSARLESASTEEIPESDAEVSEGEFSDVPEGTAEQTPVPTDVAEAATAAYQQSVARAEPARPTSLSFEA